MKYESFILNGLKVMAMVKVFVLAHMRMLKLGL